METKVGKKEGNWYLKDLSELVWLGGKMLFQGKHIKRKTKPTDYCLKKNHKIVHLETHEIKDVSRDPTACLNLSTFYPAKKCNIL